MATLTKGYTFGATETVTNTKLHNLIDDGSATDIVNADISASAAISWSKLDLSGGTIPGLSSANTWTNTNTFSSSLVTSGTVIIGTTNQGDVYYDNGSTMSRLAPGTAGKVLTTQGVTANPTWTFTLPIGSILPYGGSSSPSGYLLCDGSVVSRTTYAALYAVVGHSFGTDPGSGNFYLPDMRGRIPLGKDDMGGTSADRVTNVQADTIGGVEGDENSQAHTHVLQDSVSDKMYTLHPQSGTLKSLIGLTPATWDAATAANELRTLSTGDGSSKNLQPYTTINYIIKT